MTLIFTPLVEELEEFTTIDQSCHLGQERSMSLQRGNTTESIVHN